MDRGEFDHFLSGMFLGRIAGLRRGRCLNAGLGRGRVWPQGPATEGLEAAGASVWVAKHGLTAGEISKRSEANISGACYGKTNVKSADALSMTYVRVKT